MRRFLFLALFIFIGLSIQAQPNIWIGGSTGIWSNNASWSLNHFPTPLEDVIINTNSNIDVDVFVSSFNNINSLQITGGVAVTLSCFAGGGGGTRTLQLFSTSLVTPGLRIDASNILTIDATNSTGTGNWNLAMTGGTGVTGIIDGTLQFTGTAVATGGARLDLYSGITSNSSLVVGNTGKIIYFSNTGNTSSAPGPYLTMQSGSVYEIQKNGGSIPEATWNANSLIKITGMQTNPPLFIGSLFGNIEWNSPSQTSVATIGKDIIFNNVDIVNTGASDLLRVKGGNGTTTFTMIINGNLTLANNTVFETSGSSTISGNPGIISVKGDIINNGTIRENSNVTGNQFQLTGTSNQNISGTGSWVGDDFTFIMNNPAGATLLSSLTLPYNLQLTNGKIQTSTSNLLTMIHNATYTGGSPTSFIEGPMKKIGDEDFVFPIGVGSIYAPLRILAGTGATITDEFTARYFRLSPQSNFGTNYAGGINHISFVEYWDLVKGSSTTSTKRISLTVTAQSFCAIIASTFISHLVGGIWSNEPSVSNLTGTAPPYELGTITTTGDFSVFGPFTLATNLPINANPLPIKLISFNAIKSNSNTALLKWELATCCSDAAKFEIEKSIDNRTFVAFDKVPGSLTNRFYTLPDNRLSKGITYYRLKMIDEDGTITYSKTVAIINDETGLLITSLWPNPVQSNATVSVGVAKAGKINFTIADLSGKIVKQWYTSATEGNNNIPVNTDGLAAGVYHIIAASDNNKIVFRFIKQ